MANLKFDVDDEVMVERIHNFEEIGGSGKEKYKEIVGQTVTIDRVQSHSNYPYKVKIDSFIYHFRDEELTLIREGSTAIINNIKQNYNI